MKSPFDPLLTEAATKTPAEVMKPWLGRVHHGDCVELMNKMPVGSIDLIVTSPPHNIDDAMPHEEYVQWQRKCLDAMMRVLRDDGAIFYNHKWRVQNGLLQDRADILDGFPVRQIIIWQRKGGIDFNEGYFLPNYEVIYLIAKPDFRLADKANALGDVWLISQEPDNPHPAPFPVELAQRCINSTTGKIVLDPFIGSGTSAIAAEAARRDWIGMEISEDYCKLSRERIMALRRPIP